MLYDIVHDIEGTSYGVFADDDAAIAYALGAAQGGAVEVWRGGKLVATVDERSPSEERLAA